jgi:hypothetical protein
MSVTAGFLVYLASVKRQRSVSIRSRTSSPLAPEIAMDLSRLARTWNMRAEKSMQAVAMNKKKMVDLRIRDIQI